MSAIPYTVERRPDTGVNNVATPPPHGNFAAVPTVYRGAYEYSVPGAARDFLPQDALPRERQRVSHGSGARIKGVPASERVGGSGAAKPPGRP